MLGLTIDSDVLRAQAFERAIEIDSDHDFSYYHYAILMQERGYPEKAERLIRRAVFLRPTSEMYRDRLEAILDMREPRESGH